MVNFCRRSNCFSDNRPLSMTFEQSVTCNSFSDFFTWTNSSRASFSRCLQRLRMICSIELQPFKCSKPMAMIDESVASINLISVDGPLPILIELYSLIGCDWFLNWTAPPFLIILKFYVKGQSFCSFFSFWIFRWF